MEPSTILIIALFGGYILWRYKKDKERAKFSADRILRDTKLYENIKKGMREYRWRMKETDQFKNFINAKDKEILFETADMTAYNLDHFIEDRVGFYFKDINEYGFYSMFIGNDPEADVFENYYRTDPEFEKEERLLYEYE